MATACCRLFTVFLLWPLFSVPRFFLCIARSTSLEADFEQVARCGELLFAQENASLLSGVPGMPLWSPPGPTDTMPAMPKRLAKRPLTGGRRHSRSSATSRWSNPTRNWPTLARPHCDDLGLNHANSSGSFRREVEASILHERSPVIHSNVYRLVITRVADDETGTKWQRSYERR